MPCADPIMGPDEAWAWVIGMMKEENLLVNGWIPEHLILAAKSHARMLSRPCPYEYYDEEEL